MREVPLPESESMTQSNRYPCRVAAIDEIVDLRRETIIAGTGRASPYFEGDRDDTTLHFGAFAGARAVGCLTFLLNEYEGRPAWQLRGMATALELRGKGIGRRLLAFAEETLRGHSDARRMWYNARASAVGFYEKTGWRAVSDAFEIPGVGPHYRMVKEF